VGDHLDGNEVIDSKWRKIIARLTQQKKALWSVQTRSVLIGAFSGYRSGKQDISREQQYE